MAEEMFDIDGLVEFANALGGLNDKVVTKRVRALLMKEGTKLKKRTIAIAKSKVKRGKNPENKSYISGIKRGKVYLYKGDTWSIRAYNGRPHAHLIEDGHNIVDQNGEKHGFVKGKKVFATAERQFAEEYYKDVETFVDKLLDEGIGF